MNKIINSLIVLRGLENDGVFSSLTEYAESVYEGNPSEEKFNDLAAAVYECGAESSVRAYIQKLILTDENAFSVCCTRTGNPSDYLKNAYLKDVATIEGLFACLEDCNQFCSGEDLKTFNVDFGNNFEANIVQFYRRHGYGKFIYNRAFTYEDGALKPITAVSSTTLDQLKDYENEKTIIKNNLSDFVNGLPFSNMLLYGDKGTGKSSTVHATFNLFAGGGLKIIEVDKRDVVNLIDIKRLVAEIPLRFIIFIDDISFEEDDERLSTLKAALEGSVSGAVGNVMIIATSNRRHIVKESFSDRQNSVHPSDLLEEQLSLSDRFGLTVMFSSTDKPAYLSIVRQLAADQNISIESDRLSALAERWAILKGGRSPRRAKQFVDFVYACIKSGRAIEF